MSKKGFIIILLLVLNLMSLSGCISYNDKKESDEKVINSDGNGSASQEPVTLKILQQYGGYSQDELTRLIVEPVKQKYPNFSLELILNTAPENLAATGDFPDMVLTAHQFLTDYLNLNIPVDLLPMAKKNNLDLNKYEPIIIDEIKSFGRNGELYAIPFAQTFSALYYNKAIFDKFGVPYPKDGMTWEEVIDLGKRVARTDNGTIYKPLIPMEVRHLGSVLSLPYVDPKNNKATLTTDGWNQVFNLYKTIKDLPDNSTAGGPTNFAEDQNVAMLANYSGTLSIIESALKKGVNLNWDMVSYPNFKETPGKGLSLEAHALMISNSSKHKEEAFKIITLLTNEENQLKATKSGRLSALKDPQIKKSFGADLDFLKGKNFEGVFKNVPAKNAPPTKFYNDINKILASAAKNVIGGTQDVNTALREAEELANKTITADTR